MDFKQQLLDRLQAAKDAGNHLGWRELLAHALQLAKESGVSIDLRQFREAVLTAYDTLVAPIDIKAIPNFVEPAFDNFCRNLLDGAIDRLFELLNPGSKVVTAEAGPYTPKQA